MTASRLDDLENRLARLERMLSPTAQPTPWPSIKVGENRCATCGLDWSGAMGFVCPNVRCPVQTQFTARVP